MGYKVAIIQNRIIKGGRFHVITAMVRTLNELGIVPDIITLKANVNFDDTKKYYDSEIKFNLREILFDIKIPSDFHILYFNKIVSSYVKDYDLIINSSNSSFLLPNDLSILTMLYYPRKGRLLSEKISIHFPDGENKSWFKPAHIFDNTAALLYSFNKNLRRNEKIVAISEFTRQAAVNNYPISENDIPIIYPPVWRADSETKFSVKKNLQVCSLGRFASDKRQLEQIKIAEQLKDFEFHLMGFAPEGDKYLKQCQEYVSNNNVNNVHLHPNTDYNLMQKILKESTFFIHSLRNEPFGIVTVQGIENGCIPIVHNSGGQKEIVNIDELRYEDINSAIEIFHNLKDYSEEKLNSMLIQLVENATRFSHNSFTENLKPIIQNELRKIHEH